MKKILMIFIITLMVLLSPAAAFAHPAVPDQSLGKISVNAVNGMHTAWANVQNADGIAEHVFLMRFSPH